MAAGTFPLDESLASPYGAPVAAPAPRSRLSMAAISAFAALVGLGGGYGLWGRPGLASPTAAIQVVTPRAAVVPAAAVPIVTPSAATSPAAEPAVVAPARTGPSEVRKDRPSRRRHAH